LIIFSFWVVVVTGQDLEKTIQMADQHFEMKDYFAAGKLYQRAIFFGSKEDIHELYGKLGDCFLYSERYDMASDFYNLAYMYAEDKQLAAGWMLDKAKCHLLTGNYQLALFDLFTLPGKLPEELQKRKDFLFGVSYFATADFAKSKTHFSKAIGREDSTIMVHLGTLFAKKNHLKRPNPNTAYWMSAVMPGSGQFYSGNFKDGIYSIFLVSGLIYLAVEVAIAYTLFDAIIAVVPWMQRYYMGGMNHAEEMAEEKRDQNRNEVYKEILEIFRQFNPTYSK